VLAGRGGRKLACSLPGSLARSLREAGC
jgi:hypothetical protein